MAAGKVRAPCAGAGARSPLLRALTTRAHVHARARAQGPVSDTVRFLFQEFDEDKDGWLTRREFFHVREQTGGRRGSAGHGKEKARSTGTWAREGQGVVGHGREKTRSGAWDTAYERGMRRQGVGRSTDMKGVRDHGGWERAPV